jgi:hypothetical protein
MKFRIALLLKSFCDHSTAGIDSDNSLEASLLKVLTYETSTTAHIKDLDLWCLLSEVKLSEFSAVQWIMISNSQIKIFVVDAKFIIMVSDVLLFKGSVFHHFGLVSFCEFS